MLKKKNIILEGNILKTIIIFSLPLLLGSFIQQLYNTADMIFAGKFIDKHAAAAVGASGLIFTCIIGLLTGISVGVGIIVAQKVGQKNMDAVNETVESSIWFGIISGIILTIIGLLLAEKLLIIMNTPKEILLESTIYLKIYFMSMLPMILYNMGSGIIRSSGNSKVPFYILVLGGILNIFLNWFFIIIVKMGVAGVAIATVISQCITAIITIYYLFKENFLYKENFKKVIINISILEKILYYGLPTGIQTMMITFSNIVVQYYINGFGENAVAAYATYFRLENLIWMPIVAIGQTITVFTGQNIGAKNYKRVKSGTIIATLFSISITIIFAFIILIFSEQFFEIFINDKEVIKLGQKIIIITFPFYWLYSILETMGGSIRGMGNSIISMIIIVSTLGIFRILFLNVMSRYNFYFEKIAVVYPISWALAAILFAFLFIKYINEKIKSKN